MPDLAKDHPATWAIMQASSGHSVRDVAEAAATLLAQCCLLGCDTLDDAYAELDRHIEDMKREITVNRELTKFPVVS